VGFYRFASALRVGTALCAALMGSPGAGPQAAEVAPRDLSSKAERFRSSLLERHVTREGLLLYRIDLRSIERDLRRGTYPYLADTPTFTGLWAATACTQLSLGIAPEQARQDAALALAGLRALMDVTGIQGLLARGMRRDEGRDVSGLRGDWFPGGPGYSSYVFKGDTSMDQYANGLLPAVAECAQAFPTEARALIRDFAKHLRDHELQLIDADGQRTRFGDLSPRSGFGLNSIAQLTAYAAFAWAVELDPEGGWSRERDRLRDVYRVVARGRRTNLRILGITNHSNDLMTWNLYRSLLPLARRQRDPAAVDLRHGMAIAYARVEPDANAYIDTLACSLEPGTCNLDRLLRARGELIRFPLEKRRLEPAAALREIPRRWIPGRKFERLASERVPIELRPASSFEWKSSPYRLARPAAPQVEYTGLDYLSAYWNLARALERVSARCRANARADAGTGSDSKPSSTRDPSEGADANTNAHALSNADSNAAAACEEIRAVLAAQPETAESAN